MGLQKEAKKVENTHRWDKGRASGGGSEAPKQRIKENQAVNV